MHSENDRGHRAIGSCFHPRLGGYRTSGGPRSPLGVGVGTPHGGYAGHRQ